MKHKTDNKKQTTENMKAAVLELRHEIAKLSMDHAKKKLKQTTLLRTKKDELARMLTKMNMMQSKVKEEI